MQAEQNSALHSAGHTLFKKSTFFLVTIAASAAIAFMIMIGISWADPTFHDGPDNAGMATIIMMMVCVPLFPIIGSFITRRTNFNVQYRPGFLCGLTLGGLFGPYLFYLLLYPLIG